MWEQRKKQIMMISIAIGLSLVALKGNAQQKLDSPETQDPALIDAAGRFETLIRAALQDSQAPLTCLGGASQEDGWALPLQEVFIEQYSAMKSGNFEAFKTTVSNLIRERAPECLEVPAELKGELGEEYILSLILDFLVEKAQTALVPISKNPVRVIAITRTIPSETPVSLPPPEKEKTVPAAPVIPPIQVVEPPSSPQDSTIEAASAEQPGMVLSLAGGGCSLQDLNKDRENIWTPVTWLTLFVVVSFLSGTRKRPGGRYIQRRIQRLEER